jgi:uncharacterized protein (DUF2225 family)
MFPCDSCDKDFPIEDLTNVETSLGDMILCPDCYLRATEMEDNEVERGEDDRKRNPL